MNRGEPLEKHNPWQYDTPGSVVVVLRRRVTVTVYLYSPYIIGVIIPYTYSIHYKLINEYIFILSAGVFIYIHTIRRAGAGAGVRVRGYIIGTGAGGCGST